MSVQLSLRNIRGSLSVDDSADTRNLVRFEMELDWNLSGIWPRLHLELVHRLAPLETLTVLLSPHNRTSAYIGAHGISYSPHRDVDIENTALNVLRSRLGDLEVHGQVLVLAVDSSDETSEIFAQIASRTLGTFIANDYSDPERAFHGSVVEALGEYAPWAVRPGD